MFARSS